MSPAARLGQEFLRTGDAAGFLEGRARLADRAVSRAFDQVLAEEWPQGLALVAVGGYGRRELFPHSDIDLLVLCDKAPENRAARDRLSEFCRTLWDQGWRLSHSVRTVADCCELKPENAELTVSLLDQRLLAGDSRLYEKLCQRWPRFLSAERQSIIRGLARLAQARHARYQDTVFHLEPNVKEAPGGLRDLHLVRWLRQLNSPPGEPGLEGPWSLLSALRCWLHLKAGRDQNLFLFDLQEEYQHAGRAPRPAADLMRDYYLAARQVHRAARREMEAGRRGGALLDQFRDWRGRLSNQEITVSRERLYLRAPGLLAADPEAALRLMGFAARHGVALAPETERRVEAASSHLAAHFGSGRRLWPHLKEILSLPHAGLALRAMHETGLLQALFPEWAAIEGLVIRDFYHRYTVDEHSLIAMESLLELRRCRDPERRRFAEVLGEIGDPGLLLLALLFHDTGKRVAQSEHAPASLRLAELAMERIGVPEDRRETVRFLVARHLDLPGILNTRDLCDPATARLVADRAQTIELLKCLVLIAYADISAVNPTAMSQWRLAQLWRVYLLGYEELTRELETDRIAAPPENPTEAEAFVAGFPTRYQRTHTAADTARHLELARTARTGGVALDLSRQEGVYRLLVVTRDRPRLLAAVAGALSSFGMDIVKAEAFSNRAGEVLDTFLFADPRRTLELNPPEVDRLKRVLERVVLGKEDVERLLRGRPLPTPPSRGAQIRPVVRFDQQASAAATLVEVVAQDRPGLLYALARAFSDAGCSIDVVLIDTEAHKAIDVFYVTRDGARLSPAAAEGLRRQLEAACLPPGLSGRPGVPDMG